jgi:hypothetical protein
MRKNQKCWPFYVFGILSVIGMLGLTGCAVSTQDGGLTLAIGAVAAGQTGDTTQGAQNMADKDTSTVATFNNHFKFPVKKKSAAENLHPVSAPQLKFFRAKIRHENAVGVLAVEIGALFCIKDIPQRDLNCITVVTGHEHNCEVSTAQQVL